MTDIPRFVGSSVGVGRLRMALMFTVEERCGKQG